MNRFINIIQSGKIDKGQFKRWVFYPEFANTKVFAPFGGTVGNINTNKGSLKIKHYFDNKIYTTKLYDLEQIYVKNGDEVKQGALIGISSSKPINMEIVDSTNLEQLIAPFYTGSVRELQSDVSKPKKYEKEIQKNKQKDYDKPEEKIQKVSSQPEVKKPSEKKQENNYQQKITKTSEKKQKSNKNRNKNYSYDPYDYRDKESDGSLPFLDIGLLPLHLLRTGWNYLTKRKEDDEDLNEDIKRIKNLLK
jgi:hypothetical protein